MDAILNFYFKILLLLVTFYNDSLEMPFPQITSADVIM